MSSTEAEVGLVTPLLLHRPGYTNYISVGETDNQILTRREDVSAEVDTYVSIKGILEVCRGFDSSVLVNNFCEFKIILNDKNVKKTYHFPLRV